MSNRASRGFTLIELLIVIALIALIAFLALPTISSYFQVSLNSATRELASVIKQAYNSATVTGNVYRVAYDLKEHKYWVEAGPKTLLLDTADSKEKAERRKRLGEEEKDPSEDFQMDKAITRKKESLPRGVEFVSILSEREADPITEGVAYSHLFPHGITEQTLIVLEDTSDHKISLVISALGGKTLLVDREIAREDAFGK